MAELAVQRKAIHARLDRLREFRVRFFLLDTHADTLTHTLTLLPEWTDVRPKSSMTERDQMFKVSNAKYANQNHTCLTYRGTDITSNAQQRMHI